jgi:uncharacterized protein YkwD
VAALFVRFFLVPAPALLIVAPIEQPSETPTPTPVQEEVVVTPAQQAVQLDTAIVPTPPLELVPTIALVLEPTPTSEPPLIEPEQSEITVVPTNMPEAIVREPLFDLVNEWRVQTGRKPFDESELACQVAEQRLPQVVQSFNHSGFESLVPQLFTTYPSLHKISENISDSPTPEVVLSGWLSSPSHRKNLEQDIPYMCVRSEGRIYVQIFTDL